MHHNSQLSPFTGKTSSAVIPPDGIGGVEDVRYVRYMDSWDALRRNLTGLLQAAEDGLISGPSGVLQLEATTEVGKSTLYRILDAREKNPTQLDTLERIARAYNLQAWQLLIPRLDPLDPPEPVGSQRMKVLRSVFAQTHTEATNENEPEPHKRAPRSRPRDTDHRPPTGGRSSTGGPDTVGGGRAATVPARPRTKPKSK
jgi:hypothetical protein